MTCVWTAAALKLISSTISVAEKSEQTSLWFELFVSSMLWLPFASHTLGSGLHNVHLTWSLSSLQSLGTNDWAASTQGYTMCPRRGLLVSPCPNLCAPGCKFSMHQLSNGIEYLLECLEWLRCLIRLLPEFSGSLYQKYFFTWSHFFPCSPNVAGQQQSMVMLLGVCSYC